MSDIASPKRDYFISRAGADKQIALAIAAIIREAGFTTWLQDEDFGHVSFLARMDQASESEARVIALLSPAYQQPGTPTLDHQPVSRGGALDAPCRRHLPEGSRSSASHHSDDASQLRGTSRQFADE
jgi:hypothetical protein